MQVIAPLQTVNCVGNTVVLRCDYGQKVKLPRETQGMINKIENVALQQVTNGYCQ